jgi:hypothetical protein
MREQLASVTSSDLQRDRDFPKGIGKTLFWVTAVTVSGLIWVGVIRIMAKLAE